MTDKPRKKTDAYKRQQARLRQAQKRTADKARKAPTMVQITTAFGHAVRDAIAAERASDDYKRRRVLAQHWQAIIVAVQDRLRDGGYSIGPVTASRLQSAISPNTPITPSLRTPEITG